MYQAMVEGTCHVSVVGISDEGARVNKSGVDPGGRVGDGVSWRRRWSGRNGVEGLGG